MRWSDGEIELPYGEAPEGLLVYAPTGHFTGHLMRRGVPRFRSGARRATDQEIRAAFLGYLGYYGTYVVDESAGTVTHSVLGSWHPNWVDTDQVRHFSFERDKLVIETPPISSAGRWYRTRLVWRREDAPSTGSGPTSTLVAG